MSHPGHHASAQALTPTLSRRTGRGRRGASRREMLRMGAAAMLAAGLWPGALRAGDATAGEFRFFCVNDLHCMDEESAQWLESRLIRRMKQTKESVDFCLVLGDLAEKGTKSELGPVRDLFKGLSVPAHFVPGNHDYATGDDRAVYDDLFPKSLNYAFEHKGWQFVGIDSTQGEQYQNTSVQTGTLNWLDQEPKLERTRPTFLFTHFPLGERVTYRPNNAEEALRRFVDLNLRAVFSGHFHGFTERTVRGATLTTNRCCALKRSNHDRTAEKGYFLCEAKGQVVTRRFVRVDLD